MRYDFKCGACGLVMEHIQPMSDKLPSWLKCKKCGGRSLQAISAPMISRKGMSNESFDSVIGRDAEVRWADIHKRRAARDKVRKESGEQAVSMTGRNEFKSIKGAKLRVAKVTQTTELAVPPTDAAMKRK